MDANFNFEALLNSLLLTNISKEDTGLSKAIQLCISKGMNFIEAVAFLMELSQIICADEQEEKDG